MRFGLSPDVAQGTRAASHGGKHCRFSRPLQASTLGLERRTPRRVLSYGIPSLLSVIAVTASTRSRALPLTPPLQSFGCGPYRSAWGVSRFAALGSSLRIPELLSRSCWTLFRKNLTPWTKKSPRVAGCSSGFLVYQQLVCTVPMTLREVQLTCGLSGAMGCGLGWAAWSSRRELFSCIC